MAFASGTYGVPMDNHPTITLYCWSTWRVRHNHPNNHPNNHPRAGGACRVIVEARPLKSFPCKDLFETELPTITRQTPPRSRVIVGVIVGVIVADAPD